MWGHLCKKDCPQELSGDDLFYVVEIQKVKPGEEEEWMSNLLDSGRGGEIDELAGLRREAGDNAVEVPAESEEERKKKDKKKDKKQKEKEKKDKRRKARSRTSEKKKGNRDLDEVLGNSGLDPSPRKREKFLKKARRLVKKKKKKKEASTGSGSTDKSGTGSSDSSIILNPGEVFGQTKLAKKIWRKSSGVLTAISLGAVRSSSSQGKGKCGTWIDGNYFPCSCNSTRPISTTGCRRL